MEIAVLGINHKLADVQLREAIAKSCHNHFSAKHSVEGCCYFVLLSTCNRTEIYFCSQNLVETHSQILFHLRLDIEEDFDQKLYTYFGRDCLAHLFCVTAGLDSAILGETEIQGQVKEAYEHAVRDVKLPKELHYLFQKSLQVGKKIRSTISFSKQREEIEQIILQVGKSSFADPKSCKILFVGASAINRKIASFFSKNNMKDVTVCNRSASSAEQFSITYDSKRLDWHHLSLWHQFDWIICGTKSLYPLITKESVPPFMAKRKLVMDLGLPRNVAPEIESHRHIQLWNIDQLSQVLAQKEKHSNEAFEEAYKIVAQSAERYLDLFLQKEPQLCS